MVTEFVVSAFGDYYSVPVTVVFYEVEVVNKRYRLSSLIF